MLSQSKQRASGDYTGLEKLQGFTGDHKGSQGITRVYKGLKWVTGDYKGFLGLQGYKVD